MGHSIRYTTTDDNISIAFATLGAGRPLLCLPPFPFSHLEAGWRLEGQRFWYEQLSQSMDVALLDGGGTGLSDRDPIDFSLNAMTLDIEAVVRKLNWNQFVLCGMFNSTPLVIAYAARHPDTVTDLILWEPFARGVDVYPIEIPGETSELLPLYWSTIVSAAAVSWSAGDTDANRIADFFRLCVEPDTALQMYSAARAYDVEAHLEAVSQPTLVLHRPAVRSQRSDLAPALASRIANAELALLEGDAASPFTGDISASIAAIRAFLGLEPSSGTAALSPKVDPERVGLEAARLTTREVEVLRLLARGLSNKQIAYQLGLSTHTIESHTTNLYAKIGCRSRTEATAFAFHHGMI